MPFVYNDQLISYFAIVFSFVLISADKWLLFCIMAILLFLFIS